MGSRSSRGSRKSGATKVAGGTGSGKAESKWRSLVDSAVKKGVGSRVGGDDADIDFAGSGIGIPYSKKYGQDTDDRGRVPANYVGYLVSDPAFKGKPFVEIPIAGLRASQGSVEGKAVLSKIRGGDLSAVQVVKVGGVSVIYDGHHTVVAAKMRGMKTILAQVVER